LNCAVCCFLIMSSVYRFTFSPLFRVRFYGSTIDALANLIFDRLEVEKPNPEAPTVEIDTLYLTLVTEDNVKTEFTVEFGFPA